VNDGFVISPRKVFKCGNRYFVSIPKIIGKRLEGKLVKITITPLPLEEFDGDGKDGKASDK